MRIGVLALQGAFREHKETLERLDVETIEVRLPEKLWECDGLVLPGGETTSQRKLAREHGLWDAMGEYGRQGLPVFGTCAGMILLAKRVDAVEGLSLNLLDIDVTRNAYGRQVFSFETSLPVSRLGRTLVDTAPFQAIFIRAPRIARIGPAVSVLASYQGEAVAVQQGNLLALTFHPELTRDDRFHRFFLDLVRARAASASTRFVSASAAG